MSLDLAEAIHDDLAANTDILTYLAATNIYWLEAPEGSTADRIVFKIITDLPIYDSDDRWQRWRFYILCIDRFDCQALAEILFNHLHRKNTAFDDFKIDYVSGIDKSDPEYIADMEAWQVVQDYMIYYH